MDEGNQDFGKGDKDEIFGIGKERDKRIGRCDQHVRHRRRQDLERYESKRKDGLLYLDAAADRGVNLIDTAPVYGIGTSEAYLKAALRGRRDRFFVQTKCGLNWRKGDEDRLSMCATA